MRPSKIFSGRVVRRFVFRLRVVSALRPPNIPSGRLVKAMSDRNLWVSMKSGKWSRDNTY